jgi:uncharacterized protein YlxW (UPF0749 family)
MMSLPFDTQKMVDRLEQAGVSGEQARAHVEVLVDAITGQEAEMDERYSNKQDGSRDLNEIRAVLTRLEARVETVDAKIDKVAAEVRAELIRWVVSAGLLQTALISALLIKLVH